MRGHRATREDALKFYGPGWLVSKPELDTLVRGMARDLRKVKPELMPTVFFSYIFG